MTISEAIDKLNHAKKWSLDADFIKALEMAIKALEEKPTSEIVPIGTKVRVTVNMYDHIFNIGETVEIVNIDYTDPVLKYLCAGKDVIYYLSRSEFKIIEP